ncbi:hypothetical protein Bca4012_054907 [Brassica carinata]
MDKNEKACDLRDIVVCYKENTYHVVRTYVSIETCQSKSSYSVRKSLVDRSNISDSELCNDPKTNKDLEESSRENFADAEGSSHCNQEQLIVTRKTIKEENLDRIGWE